MFRPNLNCSPNSATLAPSWKWRSKWVQIIWTKFLKSTCVNMDPIWTQLEYHRVEWKKEANRVVSGLLRDCSRAPEENVFLSHSISGCQPSLHYSFIVLSSSKLIMALVRDDRMPRTATYFFGLEMTPPSPREVFRKFIQIRASGHPL